MLLEIILGLIAAIPILLVFKIGTRDNCLHYLMPALAYLLGSFVSWTIGLLSCLYFGFSLPGYEVIQFPLVILFLINLVTWGGLFGTIIALGLTKNKKKSVKVNLEKTAFKGFQLSGIIFIFLSIVNIINGGLNARYDIGNTLDVGSPLYFLAVLDILKSLVFVFAGMCCTHPIVSRKNILFLTTPFLGSIFLSLSGGREGAVSSFILFFLGTFYSKVSFQQIKILIVSSIPIVLALIVIVGGARSTSSFSDASPLMRIAQMYESAMEGTPKTGTDYDDPMYLLFTRIIEPSGVAVIDTITKKNQSEYIGLENFDRLGMIFIPKMFTGKKNYDDSSERLVRYGYISTDLSSAPITLMADCFERGGYTAVFIVSSVVSFVLTYLSLFLLRINNITAVLMTFWFALGCLRIYVMSLLAVINFLSFILLRDLALLYLFCVFLNYLSPQNKNKFSGRK
jgi:hypothetical protein